MNFYVVAIILAIVSYKIIMFILNLASHEKIVSTEKEESYNYLADCYRVGRITGRIVEFELFALLPTKVNKEDIWLKYYTVKKREYALKNGDFIYRDTWDY